jgi:integrase
LETNPVAGSAKADEGAPRERVLTDPELREIWGALGSGQFGEIVRLLLLTGQRREEIGGLRWSEVDFDRRLIVLSPARTKNKRLHELPLAPEALRILKAQPRRKGRDLIFGISGASGFSGWADCKARLDTAILERRKGKAAGKALPSWRLHDLRRTAATGMAELGVLPHIIEAVLNHVSGHRAGVAGVYNRARYEGEMRAALDLWAEHVAAIT